ncbi:helix-turn-helix domain-containing protein [Tropicimonas sediminicola]|uniref:Helix-turn-helix domain-containing protein n=1 Tax=Tropicimonas sediminicola TaxID=1031541 RepID=A0A239M8L3_9RHOB|nr:helix-turn-helix domain-containing protein [Tropicimonas sediminicola]SNT38149.1 Helix-turn-helix domain-containing protein [Tropicimonas sediminicola]
MTIQTPTLAETTATVPVLWTEDQAAEYLNKSVKWFQRDRWVGPTIPYLKVGRSVRYRAADVVAYVEAGLVEASE